MAMKKFQVGNVVTVIAPIEDWYSDDRLGRHFLNPGKPAMVFHIRDYSFYPCRVCGKLHKTSYVVEYQQEEEPHQLGRTLAYPCELQTYSKIVMPDWIRFMLEQSFLGYSLEQYDAARNHWKAVLSRLKEVSHAE